MGYLYQRGNAIWIGYTDHAGKTQQKSSGFKVGQEKKAKALLAKLEARLEAETEVGLTGGVVTVERFYRRWIEERKTRGLRDVRGDESKFVHHILPSPLAAMELGAVRIRDVREFFIGLRDAGKLSPKSMHNIVGVLHVFFEDAIADELVTANPVVLKRGDLPPKGDKDPLWRSTAVFGLAEVERLIGDPAVPLDRRVTYALLFLGGMRVGEVSALRWTDWNRSCAPLTALVISKQWSEKDQKEIPATKTGVSRLMPVHQLLARVLAEYRVGGWEADQGRAPRDEDLIVPHRLSRGKGHRIGGPEVFRRSVWKNLNTIDLPALGLRSRRVHDTRRTMISLARAKNANMDILKRCTHGASRKGIMDVYSELPWELFCAQVSCIEIERRDAQAVVLPMAMQARGIASTHLQSTYSALEVSNIKDENEWSRRESNPLIGTCVEMHAPAEESATPRNRVASKKRAAAATTQQNAPNSIDCKFVSEALRRAISNLDENRTAEARELLLAALRCFGG